MSEPRVLTFNFHEPYTCMMARTGLDLHVGMYEKGELARPWFEHYRPKPPNVTLIPERQWREDLAAGRYDVVIAQNELNALDLVSAPGPKLLVCHNRRSFLATTATTQRGDPKETYERLLNRLRESFTFVFISESKRDDYGVPGDVILPGIDVNEFGGYAGLDARVLRVGNMMRERNRMFDVDCQERILGDLPGLVVGENPGIPESRPAASFNDLLGCYRALRCLLHVTREEYEDGYNLVMLEAMAVGMPVVALANRTCPLTDGVDGFVSGDTAELHERLQALLADVELARAVGARGRETAARKFPMSAFVEKWRAAIENAAEGSPRKRVRTESPRICQLNVLLHYMASPITTGRYFEEAFRAEHRVITAGFRAPEEVLALWGFGDAPPPYPPHDIGLPLKTSWKEIESAFPPGYVPDVYVWVDSGPKEAPRGLEELRTPKIAYLIDSHIAPDIRLEMARHFDCTFLAQKAQVEQFRRAGVRHVYWLPLACSPVLHDTAQNERSLSVAYVGSFSSEEDTRRPSLLGEVAKRFPNHFIGKAWPAEMARIYGRAKIVVNACVNRDVNMRVFEAMASGALLITDEAEGLEDLFQDGRHLVIYRRDEDLFERIAYYLEHEEERAAIARAGQGRVFAEHTYTHRIRTMLETTRKICGPLTPGDMPRFDTGDYYACSRPELLPFVPLHAHRVLDVGCGAGAFGWSLKRYRGVKEVVGIEVVPSVAERARRTLDDVLAGSIEAMELPFPDGHFDCITCADVLEHLVDPAAVLRKLERVLAPDGVILISIPNAQYYAVLECLSMGRWQYMDRGILDRTHLRFFTRPGLARLIEDAGLELGEIAALSFADEEKCPRKEDGSIRLGNLSLRSVSDEAWHDLRVYQYRVMACKRGVDRLARAREALEANQNEAAIALAQDVMAVDEAERRRIMGKAYARLGMLEKADAVYREALELRPDAADISGEYGILLVAMNRAGEARPHLDAALAQDPENGRVLGALGLIAVHDQRFAEAFEYMRRALESAYNHTALLPHFMNLARRLDRAEEAVGLLERFSDFYPGNHDLACACAEMQIACGRNDAARERLEMVLMFDAAHARATEVMASLTRESREP